MVQCHISISGKELEKIREYAKQNDVKISQLFRSGVRKVIQFDN